MSVNLIASHLSSEWAEWKGREFWRDGDAAKRDGQMKYWETLRTTYKVSSFVQWQREGSLQLNPWFQRRSVWTKAQKSYLMDTVIRGLPIPVILLRELRTDLKTFTAMKDVVDGQQRIRTLLSFISPKSLPDFHADKDDFTISRAHIPELAGRRFLDLPPDVQSRILDYQFSVHVFQADTDDREIVQMFARMNSSGVKANAQEIRNASFFGAFKTLAIALSADQLNRWRDWGIFKPPNIARMDEVEFTSELMMLMIRGVSGKSSTAITSAYKTYDKADDLESDAIAARFRAVFDAIETGIGKADVLGLFGRVTLFYALFAAVYDLMYGLGSDLTLKTRPAVISHDTYAKIRERGRKIADKTAPERALEATTRRTTNVGERKELVKYLTPRVAAGGK